MGEEGGEFMWGGGAEGEGGEKDETGEWREHIKMSGIKKEWK